jgi:hypothetical protein
MNAEIEDLVATNMFSTVEFIPVDVDLIQKFHGQTNNSISRTFDFNDKTTIPKIDGVKEAYLGFLPAPVFLSLVCDEKPNIIKSQPLPKLNSHEMAKRCDAMTAILLDEVKSDDLRANAVKTLENVAGPDWTRDTIRTEPVTKAIFNAFGQYYNG